MKRTKKLAAFAAAVCILLTGCGKKNDTPAEETAPAESVTTTAAETTVDPDDETISVYTGRAVENEEDLAIFKFNVVLPEGYETKIDNAEGKVYVSPYSSMTVKAQNFKEEFQELEVFADSGCAGIKINNMMYQADTEFSEPMKTTVAGFDAIRYDYTVTAYMFKYVEDENGEPILDEEGKPTITDEKEVIGEYANRVYYFYSDEDVFYIICETSKEDKDKAAKDFDAMIDSITISKKEA